MTDIMDNQTDHSNAEDLPAALEALLFVASGPVSPSQLGEVLNKSAADVNNGLKLLDERLNTQQGLCLQWHKNKVQLTTAAQYGKLIEDFLGLEATSHLSRAALETLSIISYKQPTTRPQLDAIRGVNSDAVLKSLLSKGLIEEVGRAEGPGRPIMYGTTPDFLQHFGINSLDDLPKIETPEELPTDQPAADNNNGC